MNNLVLHHPFLTLESPVCSMMVTGCAVSRRAVHNFQRTALERSLNKVGKLIAAILLSFSLLTSQLAFGQTYSNSQKARTLSNALPLREGSDETKNLQD